LRNLENDNFLEMLSAHRGLSGKSITFLTGQTIVSSRPMCERYVIPEQTQVEQEFRLERPWWKFPPSFNVTAARNVPVIRTYRGETEGVMLRWGLVPDWAEGDISKGSAAHASVEDAERSLLMRGAWSRGQRCIMPMAGFYGWQLTHARYRQPYFIRVGRSVFGVAALWDRTVTEQDDDVIESCAVLTVAANALVAETSDTAHMPAILHPDDYETWLTGSPAAARSLLRSYSPESMTAHAISPRINSPKYDDANLIQPIDVRAYQYGEGRIAACGKNEPAADDARAA
jgi:putative SOS response-associated peptidase YedK